ncbi:hypothetical protein COU37_02460 [Candidatus Micrarchaeota archaeon CG10_big_fil_rev_8_21_14_0_10_45_29]|nr:MAG: hypothetical protein COU37_02460 [Candidatus Micrarchaeota archaeon CG10_big_fil_rev_8_21_14_0_10_45_29]
MFIRSTRIFIDGKLRPACLSIHTGRIGGVHSYTYMKEDALDAGDWMILPGAIDVHTHMREPEKPRKEDFTTGSQAAVAGGVTTFFDMPCYRSPCTCTVGDLAAKERLASTKSICEFGFHFGATNENSDLVKRLQPHSLKGFTYDNHSPLYLTHAGFSRHFAAFDAKKPFIVHCEDEETLCANRKKFTEHEKIHSPEAELKSVKEINSLARKFKRRVHFAHLTLAASVRAAKIGNSMIKPLLPNEAERPFLTCEVTPHHLFLSTDDLKKLKGYGMVNNPLRKKSEVAKLWKMLPHIDMVASDHAPHSPADKAAGAPGFPGVQTMAPLLLHAVVGKKLKINEAVRLLSSGPAKAFTISRKGKIAPGYDADLMVFDPADSWKVDASTLFSKAGWSPYEGWTLRGKVLGTILRGEQVFWDGEILVKPGFGELVQRSPKIGSERLVLRKHSKER